MTKNEFVEKFGNIPVVFSYYYNYSFIFKGTLSNGDIIECTRGGFADAYRFELTPDKPVLISELDPYTGNIIRNGEILDDFYEL